MSSLKVLIRSLVRTFYEANIGFFLIVLYLAFGLMREDEHIAMATSIATSLPLTLLTLLLWSLYYLKSFGFIYKTLNSKPFQFIRELVGHSNSKQFVWLFITHAIIGLPAWLYAGFISVFNFQYGTIGYFISMLGFLLIANSVVTLASISMLQKPVKEIQPGLWNRIISKNFVLPYALWYLRHLFVHEPMLAFLTKSGSLILLLGSFYLFETDIYDWRLLAVGALFAFTINSMLIYNYYEFNRKNYWIYNLPRKYSQIIFSTLITTSILFIPEIILILFQLPQSIAPIDWIGLLLFGIALAYFLLNSLSLKPITKDEYGKRVFYIMVIMLFIIMYSTPLIIINLILIGSSILIMGWHYRLILK